MFFIMLEVVEFVSGVILFDEIIWFGARGFAMILYGVIDDVINIVLVLYFCFMEDLYGYVVVF